VQRTAAPPGPRAGRFNSRPAWYRSRHDR
jgi:hypothetical protein